MVALASPVWAHGDHDARPIARYLPAGPYVISLWQVYPDAGAAMTPHLIVMFDGEVAALPAPGVKVTVNSTPMDVRPSITTSNGWETTDGIAEGDVVRSPSPTAPGVGSRSRGRAPGADLDASHAGIDLPFHLSDGRYRVLGGGKDRPRLATTSGPTEWSHRIANGGVRA